jgi:hypothetical protein
MPMWTKDISISRRCTRIFEDRQDKECARKRADQDRPARIPKAPKVEIGISHTPHISSSPNIATGMPLRC